MSGDASVRATTGAPVPVAQITLRARDGIWLRLSPR